MRRDVSADFCASAVLVLRSGSDFILPFTRSVMARQWHALGQDGTHEDSIPYGVGYRRNAAGREPFGSAREQKTAPTRPKPIVKLLDMAYKEARFSLSPS